MECQGDDAPHQPRLVHSKRQAEATSMQPISPKCAASSFHTLLNVELDVSAAEPSDPPTPSVLKHTKGFLFFCIFYFDFFESFSGRWVFGSTRPPAGDFWFPALMVLFIR